MVTCETSDSTSSPAIGIVLVLLACCCYAFGNCMQRYSLLKAPGEKVFGVLNRHVGWLVGAIIYFSANGIYAVALSFAPVSTLAAVFSLTIVANAVCATLLLGDKIPKWAYPGYALVLAGSIVFSVVVSAQVCHFDGNELIEVMTTPQAIVFWVVLGLIIFGGVSFAWRFEKAHPIIQQQPVLVTEDAEQEQDGVVVVVVNADNVDADAVEQELEKQQQDSSAEIEAKPSVEDEIEPRALLFARFIYPASLGATEATGALILKAVNSLLTVIATDKDENDGSTNADKDYPNDVGLWVGLIVVGVFLFLGIVLWLRLVYSRFEITGAFPVEFGMLTLASVVGGFAVFQDYHFVETAGQWAGVGVAGVCIIGGIAIVGYTSWRAKVLEEARRSDEPSSQHSNTAD